MTIYAIIGGTGAVPDHLHHHRGAVILDHHHIKAVFQPEGGDSLGLGGKGQVLAVGLGLAGKGFLKIFHGLGH